MPSEACTADSYSKAIIADTVGQIAEYIKNGEPGILVNSDDEQEFARALLMF